MTEAQATILIASIDNLENTIGVTLSIPLSILLFLITFFGLIMYFKRKI